MCPEYLAPFTNRRGIGLITAVFAVVILSLFGLLIARYTTTTQISSVEDYLWAQALYSAESTMRLNILRNDGGGNFSAAPAPLVGQIPTKIIPPSAFNGHGNPSVIRVQAIHDKKVSRTVEAKYIL